MRALITAVTALFAAIFLLNLTEAEYQDHYKVLGLDSKCSQRDVKKSYIKLSLKWHPDKHSGQKKELANQEMVRINAAYEVLSNPERRAEYDQEQKYGYSFESFSDFDFSWSYRYEKYEIPKSPGDILRDGNIENKYESSFETEVAQGAWLIFVYDDNLKEEVAAAKAFVAAAKALGSLVQTAAVSLSFGGKTISQKYGLKKHPAVFSVYQSVPEVYEGDSKDGAAIAQAFRRSFVSFLCFLASPHVLIPCSFFKVFLRVLAFFLCRSSPPTWCRTEATPSWLSTS